MDRGTTNGVFLVLGPPRARWPQPLDSLVAKGHIKIEPTPTFHTIAARIAGGNGQIRGLLIDPCVLTTKDLESVRTITRFVQIPVVLLPVLPGSSPRAKDAPDYGILTWDQAAPALATLHTPAKIPSSPAPLPEAPHSRVTDKKIAPNPAPADENPVTSDPANRYDELANTPLVSPQELAALLGASD